MVSHMATGVHKEVYVVDQRRAVPSARGAREAPLQHRKTDSAGTVMVMELLMDDDCNRRKKFDERLASRMTVRRAAR